MAVTQKINIETNAKKASKDVEGLSDSIDKTSESQSRANDKFKEASDDLKDIKKSSKAGATGVKKLTKGFKGMGLAIKAVGIGLAIEAFQLLKETLGRNQEVVDFFNTSMNAVSIVVNDLFSFISENSGAIVQAFSDVFNNPLESIKQLGNAIKANVIERFESMIDSLGFAATAVKEFFSGNFEEAKDAAVNAGKELVDVATGVDDSFDKTVKAGKEAADSIKEYGNETIETARSQTELAKASERAQIINEGLLSKYENQAERLRQQRDNERASVEDRIAASVELRVVLEKQQEAMLNNARITLEAARANLKINDTEENRNAVLTAQNRLADIRNQIQSQNSEQLTSQNALLREQNRLQQQKAKAALNAEMTVAEALAENIDNEVAKIEQQDYLAERRFMAEKRRIREQIKLEEEGSARRMELENEMAMLVADNAAREIKTAKEKTNAEVKMEKAKEQAKLNIMTQGLGAIQGLAKEGSAFAKGLAVAQATINTYQAATNALANTPAPPPFPQIAAGINIVSGLAQVKKILSTDPMGASGGGGSISTPSTGGAATGGGAAASAVQPQFNTVQGAQNNQLLGDVRDGINRPNKAYVVSKEVSTAQEADRNRVKNAKLAG